MQRTLLRIVWCTFLLFPSLLSLHAEDFWQDTLWIRKIPLGGNTYSKVMFHPDSKSVFATSDFYMFQYDVVSGEILKTRTTKSGLSIADYELTSDNKYFIIGTNASGSTGKSVIEIWSVDLGYVRTIPLEYMCISIALSPDDKYVYVGYEEHFVEKFMLETGIKVKSTDKAGGQINVSPDGQEVVSTFGYPDSKTYLLDATTLEYKKSIVTVGKTSYDKTGRYIAGGGAKNIVYLYDREENQSYPLSSHKGELSDVCFTADGKYVLSCSRNEESGGYRAWGVNSKKLEYTAPFPFNGGGMAVSPNNHFITFGGGGSPGIFTIRMPMLLVGVYDATTTNECIDIFPNPSQDIFNVKIGESIAGANITIRVSDMKGNTIYNDLIINPNNIYQLNVKDFAVGKYSIQLLRNTEILCSSSFIINR